MKHTFYFIDKLMVLIKDVPIKITSNKESANAFKLIEEIERYAHTLRQMVENHKNTEYLNKLEALYVGDVMEWSSRIKQLFKNFDDLLLGLEEYMQRLKKILDSGHYDKWGDEVGNLAMRMVMLGLHDDEELMIRLRKEEIVNVSRLRHIIEYEEHIAELLQ